MGLGSALIGLAGNAVCSAANVGAQAMANQQSAANTAATNKANKELAEQQNKWNQEQWERENAYNHPAEQAKRLQEAGLSSAAAAHSVSGGNAAPLQSANLANQVAPPPPGALDFSGFASDNMIGVIRQLVALKKENAEASIAETQAKWEPERIFTELQAKQAAYDQTIQQIRHEMQMFPYRFAQGYYKTKVDQAYFENYHLFVRQQELNVQQMQQQVDSFWRNNDINYAKSVQELRNLFQQGKNLEKQGENIDADTNFKNSQTAANYANVNKTNAETQNIIDANEGVKANSRIQQVQAILAENGYPDNFQQRVAGLMASGQMSDDQCLKFIESIGKSQNLHRQAAEGNAELWQYYLEVFDEGWKSTIDKATGVVGKGLDIIGKVSGAPNVTKFVTNRNNIYN